MTTSAPTSTIRRSTGQNTRERSRVAADMEPSKVRWDERIPLARVPSSLDETAGRSESRASEARPTARTK